MEELVNEEAVPMGRKNGRQPMATSHCHVCCVMMIYYATVFTLRRRRASRPASASRLSVAVLGSGIAVKAKA